MQTIVKAVDSADFLSLIPSLAGFTPRDSLVVVPFRRNRTVGLMRFDLPHRLDPVETDQVASTLVGTLCRIDGVDGAVIVVYTDERATDAGGRGAPESSAFPAAALVDAMLTRFDTCGIATVDALGHGADGWWSFLEPEAGIRPRDEIAERARHVPQVSEPPAADQWAGAALPVVDPAARKRVARALAAIDRLIGEWSAAAERIIASQGSGLRTADALLDALDDARHANPDWAFITETTAFIEQTFALDPSELEARDLARLGWLLARPSMRDVALLQWCDGRAAGERALDAQHAWEDGEPYPALGAARFFGEGPKPDPDRLARALALVRHVAAHLPRRERPGSLAAAGWLAWARGSSTHATRYAADALRIDPSHGLSQIIATLTANGHLPEWGFSDT